MFLTISLRVVTSRLPLVQKTFIPSLMLRQLLVLIPGNSYSKHQTPTRLEMYQVLYETVCMTVFTLELV